MDSIALKDVVERIFKENEKRTPKALLSDRNVQNRFATSYKGRYFHELLQNSRDAIAKANKSDGRIKAWLDGSVLYFANNGEKFDINGIESICYPAISTKHGTEMIGHKGIGFNSVLEVTSIPSIITNIGTINFDVDITSKQVKLPPNQLPLFQFPHFNSQTIESEFPELSKDGFTTVFKLPLNKSITPLAVAEAARAITGQDLIFVGKIHNFQFNGNAQSVSHKAQDYEILSGDTCRKFQQFSHDFELSEFQIEGFDEDEKERFLFSKSAECKILLSCDSDGIFLADKNSKVYLFYAMEIISGFSFSIHSLFSVSIDRKRLIGDSKLNMALFSVIAKYVAGEFLEEIKRQFPAQVLEILSFKRVSNAHLEALYNTIKSELIGKKFIWHHNADDFLSPSEILLVTKDENNLFIDAKLGDKFLLYVEDATIFNWLITECCVRKLSKEFILLHIEEECEKAKNRPDFFNILYRLNSEWNLPLDSKRVLLNQHNNLVAGANSTVFYKRKNEIRTPQSLDSILSFLHRDIRMQDIREASARMLGLKEFSEEQLLSVAIKQLNENLVNEIPRNQSVALDMIHFIKSLNLDWEALLKVKAIVYLPVINRENGNAEWKNPLYTPIYFDDFAFSKAYNDKIYYVDIRRINSDETTIQDWKFFLEKLGVWRIPGMFLSRLKTQAALNPKLNIDKDRLFHMPTGTISSDFSNAIIDRWDDSYHPFITGCTGTEFALRLEGTQVTPDSEKIRCSTAIYQLSTFRWIIPDQSCESFAPDEVVAISDAEFFKTPNQILRSYLILLRVDESKYSTFLNDLKVMHFSNYSIENYKGILAHIKGKYGDSDFREQRTPFEKFYNRILSFLHDCLSSISNSELGINAFKTEYFLCRSLLDNSLKWCYGKEIIYLDQRAVLDQLTEAKLLSHLANPFTFTKKARKEWGKFGQKIGTPISRLVSTSVLNSGREIGLFEIFDFPEVLISLVEEDLSTNFKIEQLEALRGSWIHIHNELVVEVKIDKEIYILKRMYFIEHLKDKSILHLDEGAFIDRDRSLCDAFADYFEQFSGEDVKRLDLIIETLLKSQSKHSQYQYAIGRDVDSHRLEEIAEILLSGSIVKEKTINHKSEVRVISDSDIKAEFSTLERMESKTVKEITFKNGLKECIRATMSLESGPILIFKGEDHESFVKEIAPSKSFKSVRFATRQELSDRSKAEIGLLGEVYIFNQLKEKNSDLLSALGIELGSDFSFEWYNQGRLEDPSLEDGSKGIGFDLKLSNGAALEVKAMVGESDLMNITGVEFDKMRQYGNLYFLVIVKNLIKMKGLSTTVICDPYKHILEGKLHFLGAQITVPNHYVPLQDNTAN